MYACPYHGSSLVARLNSSTLARGSCFLKSSSWPLAMAASTSGIERRWWDSGAEVGVGVAAGRGAATDWVERVDCLELSWANNEAEPSNSSRRANEQMFCITKIVFPFGRKVPFHEVLLFME